MEKNVFFFSHKNAENAEADSVSKYNMFEVRWRIKLSQYASALKAYPFNQVSMIRDLVIYFLKQGPYDGAGDIAVLCAYLGQLQKVRAALKDLKIAVSVDERDEDQLERAGLAGDDEVGFAQVHVAKHVGTTVDFWWFTVLIILKDPHRNGRHLPRPRGQDRDHFFGSKFRHVRGRPIRLDWLFESMQPYRFAYPKLMIIGSPRAPIG
jgi:hypothetical protein